MFKMNDFINIYPKGNKILFVGTLPPPIGGVSVHISRAVSLLKENNYNISVFDTSKKYLISYVKVLLLFTKILLGKYNIVHVHTTRTNILKIVLKAQKYSKFKLYFTDHNPRLFANATKTSKIFYQNFILNVDLLIAVSEEVILNYKKNDIRLKNKHIIRNAFLPPNLPDEEKIISTYDNEILQFLDKRKPILVSSAYKLSFINNIDLYGLDMCIELTNNLKKDYNNIGYIFVLPDTSENEGKLQEYQETINNLKLNNNILIVKKPIQLWPIIKNADIFIRPTITDGDALSIREALMFNKPVIASDVCTRPDNVTIFRNRDIEDLTNKSVQILK